MRQVFKIIIELDDINDSDADDVELAVEEALAYLSDDLVARIVECDLMDGPEYEDY